MAATRSPGLRLPLIAILLPLLLLLPCSSGTCSGASSPSSSSSSSCGKGAFWEPGLHGFLASTVFDPTFHLMRLPSAFDPFYASLELPLVHPGNSTMSPALCDPLQASFKEISTSAAEALLPSLSEVELEEANLLVAMANQRFLHCQLVKKEPRVIPASIARLHVALSSHLDRKPSLSYIHLVLNNCWKRSDHALGDVFVQAPSFELRYLLSGLKGERGFYLSHCEVEALAIPVVKAGMAISSLVCEDPLAAGEGEPFPVSQLVQDLNTIADSIRLMIVSLKRMFRYVTPKEFLYQVRPFFEFDELKSPKGVTFEGLFDDKPQFFPGPTGAMTSTLPFIDAILSLKLQDPTLNHLMSEFRAFWPKAHRTLIERLESCPFTLQKLLTEERYSSTLLTKDGWEELSLAYDDVLTAMGELRAAHVLHTETFILSQLPQHVQKNMLGTGGTPFTRYLCTHALDTMNARVRKDSPSIAIPHSCFQGISLSQIISAAQSKELH